MRHIPRQWTFTGRSGRTYVFDVVRPGGPFRAQGAVYVLVHLHPRGHLAGFVAAPVAWSHTDDMRAAAVRLPGRGAGDGPYYSHVCTLYCDLPGQEREALLRDLELGTAHSASA